jgi:hypothetical protein
MNVGNRLSTILRPRAVPRMFSVIAQDPSVKDAKGRILMASIRVPPDVLLPGPIGYRVQIVDYDATEARFHGAHALPETFEDEPNAWGEGRSAILADYRFHAQNVYALVMKTLARFEHALGRRISWSFQTHQLKVAPHGMLDANAFYTPTDEGLVFGYFPGRSGETVYTCLSHDVVVHETVHALLDALRERFLDPSSPDQAAFHEGFADVIALLSVFAQDELVQELLRRGRTRTKGVPPDMIHASDVTLEALKRSALFGLAEQMGEEMEGVRGSVLRRSTTLPTDPALKDSAEFLEPHRRGELLVAAVLHAFVAAWAERVDGLAARGEKRYLLARVAEAGADIAEMLVTLWIRAIDYMPPVHLEFGDALSAALTADLEARPDDSRYRLRAHTMAAFKAYGFGPAVGTSSVEGTWCRAPADLHYENVRCESMRTDKDEVFRFLWENREALELRSGAYAQVLSVRPCTRVGEDGFTLRETVAEYYQVARLTPEELRGKRIEPPEGWVRDLNDARLDVRRSRAKALGNAEGAASQATDEDGSELVTPLYGGGTLVFDEYGRLKYHVHNDVFGARQSQRLAYLYQAGLLRAGRTGARLSADRLSALHRLRALDLRRFPQEGW